MRCILDPEEWFDKCYGRTCDPTCPYWEYTDEDFEESDKRC